MENIVSSLLVQNHPTPSASSFIMSNLFNSHISEMHNVCCLPSIFYMYRRSVSDEKWIAWVMTRWHPIINDSHTLYRLGCRQTVLRNQYRKKSARHVKVCWQSHLRNAQRSLLRCKRNFLNQTFRHNQQVAYNILKSMDQLFYKASTKHVRTCIWKNLCMERLYWRPSASSFQHREVNGLTVLHN